MDVASKQQKTLKNVLYYGLPVLAILMMGSVLGQSPGADACPG